MASAPLQRSVQKIQAKFEERFACLGFAACVLEQSWNVWKAQRDAYARERSGLRHWIVKNTQDSTGAGGLSLYIGGSRGGQPGPDFVPNRGG